MDIKIPVRYPLGSRRLDERRCCHATTLIKGLLKFLSLGYSKDTVQSLFNKPKIISCQKWIIRVRIWVMATSERSKLLNRRPKIISCQKLTIVVLIVHF